MKDPVKYTGDSKLLTTRQRKVYPGFVPPGALLQRRESERTSQIFFTDDELECGPLNPANNAETIMFQSDPTLRIKLAKLHQAKKQVQAEIKVLRQKISKHEYARVVRRHTVMTRGWVAKRPPKFRHEPSKPVYDWVPKWLRTELVSEEEWLKRMLQLTTLRVQQRKDYERRLAAWAAHPEWERRPYRYWREGLFFIRKTIFPAGHFGWSKVPEKEFKAYPRRRWDLIRADWSRRLNSIRPRLTKLQQRYDSIKSELAVLYYHTESKPMCYSQDVEWAPINRQDGRRLLELTGFPSRGSAGDGFMPGGIVAHWMSYSGLLYAALQPLEDWSTSPGQIPEREFELSRRFVACHLTPCRMWEWNSHVTGNFSLKYDYGPENRLSRFNDAVGVRVEVLDDVKRLEEDLEDRLRSARLALLNLRLGRDVVEFNPFRSLLEQKDVPQTFRTGREFMRFARSSLGNEYYEVITSSGHKTLLTRSSMSSAQRQVLLGSTRYTRSALRAAGLKRATRQVVTKRTGLRILAGLYLAWKFAIAPTQSDVNAVLDKGYDYVMTCRRGLDQLVRKKGLHFWESRSLYRTFKVGDPRMLAQKSHSRLIDVDIPVHSTLSIPWSLEIPDDHLRLWFQGIVPEGLVQSEYGPVYEAKGVPLWFPCPADLDPTHRFEYLKGIWLHNLDTIVQAVPERYRTGLVSVRQVLRGKLYARFRAKELLRGLGDGSIRDKIAWANLYKTAWDLLPCSFVVEWFTNLGEVATATNDLVNAMITGLNTSKKTWASLSSTVFANEPVFPELDITITATPTRFRRLWVDPFPEFGFALSVHDFTSCFEGVVRLNCNLPQTARLLRNTAIRTSVRRVVDTAVDTPRVRLRVSITPPQAGSLAAMLLSGG